MSDHTIQPRRPSCKNLARAFLNLEGDIRDLMSAFDLAALAHRAEADGDAEHVLQTALDTLGARITDLQRKWDEAHADAR
jgi:hypothetical protein